MSELVQITLHGKIGKEVGESWRLAVGSVAEAIHAINVLGKQKFNKFLARKENVNAEYRVLINGEDFISEEPLNTPESVKNIEKSNLAIPLKGLRTIDIIPAIEGADNVLNMVLGVILIAVGAFLGFTGIGVALIFVGVGLLAQGIMGLLAKPPGFEDFREIEGGKKVSYLFNGPENTTREGGPVPIGYGQLLIGSQVIAASYNTYDVVSEEGELSTGNSINDGNTSDGGDGITPS